MSTGFVLTVGVISGRDFYKTQAFGKQDPYVSVKVGKRKFTTSVCEDAGTSGEWNETFAFDDLEAQVRLLTSLWFPFLNDVNKY